MINHSQRCSFTLSTARIAFSCHSHTVEVNELTLSLIALSAQEVFKVFDLVRQLWGQIELCWKLRDPVPGGQNEVVKKESAKKIQEEDGLVYSYTIM